MGKKEKSKARLDKYYYLAKEHGFRSRASFKLIQLNKKYSFLESATCLIDLCAAPGGWLQVAAKYMPMSSIKIGVDLDPIKPVHGCTTFQADITSEKCRFLIKKEIKHFKADVVLNDGAPNVGGNWTKDAFNQSELVLWSVKLASEFLKEGGTFITKVFRSSDYNSLMYVLKQLFNKVEATKPQASRNESAEIFVVCLGYKAPSFIDQKLLDPKYALKQLEDEEEMKMNTIKSIKSMFDQKTNRSGYTGKLYNERSFKDYIECVNPYMYLNETNKIKISTDECRRFLSVMKCPIDYQLYFEDIQILGKKEVQELIIWRNKIRMKVFKKEKEKKEDENAEEEEDLEEYGEKKLDELDQELTAAERQKKKKSEISKKKHEKNELKMKMSFINDSEKPVDNNGVEFDQGLFDFIKKQGINIEEIAYKDPNSGKMKIPKQDVNEIDLANISDLSETDYIEMMNDDIEQNDKLYEETKLRPSDVKKKKSRKQAQEEYRRLKKEDEEKEREALGLNEEKKKDYGGIQFVKNEEGQDDMDALDDEDLELHDEGDIDEDNLDIEEEDNLDMDMEEDPGVVDFDDQENPEDPETASKPTTIPNDDEYLSDEIENPLRKKKNVKALAEKNHSLKPTSTEKDQDSNDENNLEYDTDDEKDNKMTGKKRKRSKKDEFDDIVAESDDSDYDMDDVAEIRAIAKKMLRKKERNAILYKTYNKYAYSDYDRAPGWFTQEEKQHTIATRPVTKDEIMAEKEALKKLNDRMPKKVLEAKSRKRNKAAKRMQKVRQQAQSISNQEEISELSKLKQIKRLYSKEKEKLKEKKKYVVSRSFKKNDKPNTRNIKHVDKRLKKDKRAQKASDKRKGKKR